MELVHTEKLPIDLETGRQDSTSVRTPIGRVILLPSRVVVRTFSVFRSKDHPGGAFYSEHELIGLIDRRELASSVEIKIGDVVEALLKEESYKIAGILNLYGENFVEVGLTAYSAKKGA